MRACRRTKILATIGPASSTERQLMALLRSGVDIVRINASHTTPTALQADIRRVRRAESILRRPIGVLIDVQGPRIRTGDLYDGPVRLVTGTDVRIAVSRRGTTAAVIATPYRSLLRMVRRGHRIYIDNGMIRLRATRIAHGHVVCRVVRGGMLGAQKGMNLPDTKVVLPALTSKDRTDLAAAMATGVDYVALSFVQCAKDVQQLQRWLKRYHQPVPVVAKIEKPSAVDDIAAILDVADGVMVARGDLGVEMGLEEVPIVQARLITRARQEGVPVIIATQMLETMMTQPQPTRAEVSDIANAVFEGTDAVMLSGETAVGPHGVGAVRMMSNIAIVAERERRDQQHAHGPATQDREATPIDGITRAAVQAAHDMNAQAMLVFTRSGRTAHLVSSWRPDCPIIALVPRVAVARQMLLLHGVRPLVVGTSRNTDTMIRQGDRAIMKARWLSKGAQVIMVSGRQALPGARYMAKVHHVGI